MCDDGQARKVNFKRAPKQPTEKEIMEHSATHVPYRSWCPHCVAAAAKASPHKTTSEDKDERSVPFMHTDYWFMRDDVGSESVPVVVIKDDDTKAYGAHVVTVKGAVDWVAAKLVEDIEKFGHVGKVGMKSDQEAALKDLVNEVKDLRAKDNRETILEDSKVYDSQSNGGAERAVQSIECVTRTHKFALEKNQTGNCKQASYHDMAC